MDAVYVQPHVSEAMDYSDCVHMVIHHMAHNIIYCGITAPVEPYYLFKGVVQQKL